MKNNLVIISTLLMSLLFLSCTDKIEGDGPVVTNVLELEQLDSFTLNGAFNVEVNYGEVQKIEVTGQQNIIDRLNTWVENGSWNIRLAKGGYRNLSLKIKITLPKLTKAIVNGSGDIHILSAKSDNITLEIKGSGDMYMPAALATPNKAKLLVDGSGNIKVDDLNTKQLTTIVKGSGNVSLIGSADVHTITIEGSGSVQAYNLDSENCSVHVRGSGDVNIDVENTLDVQIQGSGDVNYKGNATVTANIDGSGSVQNVN